MPVKNILQKFFCLSLVISYFAISPSLQAATWSEETLKTLSLQEKIAQLFMIPVWSNDVDSINNALSLIEKQKVGGIIFFQGSIREQLSVVKKFQKMSSIPLLVGQDNEWGLQMRLHDAMRFPRNLMLGAIENNQLIYEFAKEVARQCRGVGVHVNFAPVIDINNNPKNPVINDRSFGESLSKVSEKGLLIMKGLQENGVIACAKHFPGHGDTSFDSHLTLPIINKSLASLENLEWKPFELLINEGLESIMTAHLMFPLLSKTHPSSLSKILIQNYLKEKLKFEGLIFTDSLKMQAITENFEVGDSELLALKAGNDVILQSTNPEIAIKRIMRGIKEYEISEAEIDFHVLKILKAKEKLKLHQNPFPDGIDLFSASAINLKKRLYYEALTLVKNKNALPLKKQDKIAFIQIGRDVLMKDALELVTTPIEEQTPKDRPPLYDSLAMDYPIDYFFLPKQAQKTDLDNLVKKLDTYDSIVIGIYEMNKYSKKNYGICHSTLQFLETLSSRNKKVYINLFGSPYSLKYFNDQSVIIMAYENDEDAQRGCSEILQGKYQAKGRLPISASPLYPEGFGL